jgi:predicted DNA-binding transcriptional regulator YafY
MIYLKRMNCYIIQVININLTLDTTVITTENSSGNIMSLGIYNTLKELILENVNRSRIEDAIDKKQRVRIYYMGEDGDVSGYRNIEPYVLGLSKANNPIIRAWQINGVTDTESPMWKTFRVDKIRDWRPYPNYFFDTPSERPETSSAPNYRQDGDDSMITIYKQARF